MGRTRARWIRIVAAASLAAVLLALGPLADPLAAWATRRALRGLDGYSAGFRSVDVRLLDLTYVVEGLRVSPAREGAPLAGLAVERAEVVLDGRRLLRGDLVARVTVDAPVVRLVKERAGGGDPYVVRAVAVPDAVPTTRLERLEVHRGELIWTDATAEPSATLRLHAIEGTVEGLATAADAPGGGTTFELTARLQESGAVRANIEAEPGADRLTFQGTAELDGLELVDVADLIRSRSGFEPEGGSFHATLEARGESGEISGAVRPVVESPDLTGEGDALVGAAKGLAAEALIGAYTGDVEGADAPAIAGTIPIHGSVGGAPAAIPTFLSLAATALARGLSSALSVPPGTERAIRVVEAVQDGGG